VPSADPDSRPSQPHPALTEALPGSAIASGGQQSQQASGRAPLPPRVLGDVKASSGSESAPVLVCLGGVHGNEPAGVVAVSRVVAALKADPSGLVGRLVCVTGNRAALSRGQRYLDRDLNRSFVPERLVALRVSHDPHGSEEREALELVALFDDLAEEESSGLFLLDLHSTSSHGAAFAILDDTLANRAFAFALPVPRVLGLEEEVSGTITAWANRRGIVAAAFECGQHDDPESVARAEAAVWIALESSGVIAKDVRREAAAARHYLCAESVGLPSVCEVRYRHALGADHDFTMQPGYRNFHPVNAGELLASDGDDPVTLDHDALLLMPLYQGQGEDGFFIVHEVNEAWLSLSAIVRRLHLHHLLPVFPGVTRHPERRNVLIVDRHRARWLALELFHLLGYRREAYDEDRYQFTRRDRR